MIQAAKRFKASRTIKITGFSALMILLGACSSTPILQDDGEIPPPALSPSGDQLTPPVQIQTTTIIPSTSTPTATPTAKPAAATAPSIAIAPSSSKPTSSTVKYTVKKGDSLWKVSKMFDVSVGELAAYNKLNSKAGIQAGQVLQIPPGGLSEPKEIAPIKSVAPKSQVQGATYTVKSGDSLWTVAKRNNISVKQLADANNLSSTSQLKVGQKLIIPAGKPVAQAATQKIQPQSTSVKPAATPASAPKTAVTPAASTTPAAAVSKPASAPAVAEVPAVVRSEAVTAPSQSDSNNYLPHTVRSGDSWQAISDMYGVTVEELKKVNPSMANEAQPKVGTVVNIPED